MQANIKFKEEDIISNLTSIYQLNGYSTFKMNKFEEYDLYSKNKDFLISEEVITFTDTNGKLMALKPDVTLSIIKNNNANGSLIRLFYNENVYRVSKGTSSFKEIMQSGIECIGDIDEYAILEVLTLACKSLNTISPSYVLDISSLDILESILSNLVLDYQTKKLVLKAIEEKNINELEKILKLYEIDNEYSKYLIKLLSLPSSISLALPIIKEIAYSLNEGDKYEMLYTILNDMKAYNIRIDFSVVSNLNYYNGIVFKGFIEGIPTSVLSGGQYDPLMKRMKKKDKGIGFAIYLDTISFLCERKDYDVDEMIIYSSYSPFLNEYVSKQTSLNKKIFVCKKVNSKIKYRRLVEIEDSEVIIREENA